MIYVLSGGGTKLFAAIGVTYPEGSTCTCTNGTKTFTAKNTNGEWAFSIPSTGTWTVSCTDGTNTKSQSVSITKEGQFESVVLSYRQYLFDNGEVAQWKVGNYKTDWASASVGTTLKGTTKSGSTYNGWCILTEEYHDLSNYSKVGINVDSITPNKIYIGVVDPSITDDDATTVREADSEYIAFQEITKTGITELDISSFNGSYRIGLLRDWWQMSASSIVASQVWLE